MTQLHPRSLPSPKTLAAFSLLAAALVTPTAQAQKYPVTPEQRATAQKVALAGVPLSELAPDAPDEYLVKRGDTLWAISRVFLKSPWRWPELWGRNIDDINNPHLIYPGQLLVLDKSSGQAVLRGEPGPAPGTVKLSPRARAKPMTAAAVPTLSAEVIEPFLAEPLVLDENELKSAPRIVATQENRVLLGKGDRAYARGPSDNPLRMTEGSANRYRVFRQAKPMKDPQSGETLAYEAQYIGEVELARSEAEQTSDGRDGPVPATFDVLKVKEELRAGDRMRPEPPPPSMNFMPHAPADLLEARVLSLYGGNAVRYAAQYQVVSINRGKRDGIEPGQVFALLTTGAQVVDKTDGNRDRLQLPDERNGLAMVFRTFDRVAYVLILESTQVVKVGDRLVNPN